ncbi:DUF2141 domain-containing protein [Fibrella sp. WM1]|uniref:DUF2141 domain-containing protein n=1 Tax=Fibrella musci TaxID=3242485 RepID=UPI0035228DF6
MKTLLYTIALLIAALFVHRPLLAQNSTYKLTINIPNISQRTGTMHVGLIMKPENFMGKSDLDTAVAVPAEGPLTIVIPNLKAGQYAIQLYQDLNNNKVMDRAGMMPTEPFGFSNIAMLMGPPSFDQAAFEVKEDTEIRVRLMGR